MAGEGIVNLKIQTESKKPIQLTMNNVLHVPEMSCNLMSVRQITDHGFSVTFKDQVCKVSNNQGRLIAKGIKQGNLYILEGKTDRSDVLGEAHVAMITTRELWHNRLAHIGDAALDKLSRGDIATGIVMKEKDERSFCEGCARGKQTRSTPKPLGEIRADRKLQIIHSDVMGPVTPGSLTGKAFVITFTDDHTRMSAVAFMKHKSEALEKFREYQAIVEGESGLRIGVLRTDRGGEYTGKKFKEFLREQKIKHEETIANTPEQNGISERLNRTLMEKARSMVAHAGLSKKYWAEAVNTACYLKNRSPCQTLKGGKTPYEKWYGKKPDLSNLKTFGCVAFVHIPDSQRRKLEDKTKQVRFLGYAPGGHGYRVMEEKSLRILLRRDVLFDETRFEMTKKVHPSIVTHSSGSRCEFTSDTETVGENRPNAHEPNVDAHKPEEAIPEVVRPRTTRQRVSPKRYGIDEVYLSELNFVHSAFSAEVRTEPTTMKEALTSADKEKWKAAAQAEFDSLQEHETWELCDLPPGRKAVGSKWVFKIKYREDGTVDRYKCRLVAQGFTQAPGVDYSETFAPVARFGTIRTLLAIGVQREMSIQQMDVTTAFLNGTLKEDIYMNQPAGFEEPGNEHSVCHLKKSLYGLKQSPRCWYEELSTHLVTTGFQQSRADPCVFYKWIEGQLTIISVYVDDLILLTDLISEMKEIKKNLSLRFKMKDLGALNYCLGIGITHGKGWMQIQQRQYITNLLDRFNLKDAAYVTTPADISVPLVVDDGVSMPADQQLYQRMIGSLQYAAGGTRPDIAYIVGVLARFCHKPNQLHLTAAKRVFRYLGGTADLALTYNGSGNENLTGYSDADWAGDRDSRRSTSGNVFVLGNGAITWSSKRQNSVALSTVEAEYMALSQATQEAVWLRRLTEELGQTNQEATTIYEDNQGAICTAQNPVFHRRTKHIHIRYHYVREAVSDNTIKLVYCPTSEMSADLLTKTIPKDQYEYLREKLGLRLPM